MKKTIIISAIALFLVVGGAKALTLIGSPQEIKELVRGQIDVEIVEFEESFGAAPVLSGESVDLVGTQIGTSTTGVAWYGNLAATTTYPFKIGTWADKAVFTIKATLASTTAGGGVAYFSILFSNDRDCDTASTSTSFADTIITNQINWFDAGSYIRNASAQTSFNGTTTLTWTGIKTGNGEQIILDGLNSECLALQINASSTILWVQYKTKHSPNN